MKVKNIMFSGFMAVILMGVAGNASAALEIASKAYVDNRVDIADTTTVAAELEKKADKSEIGTLPDNATATTIVGYIEEKTNGIATDENLSKLTERVDTAESDIDALESAMTGDGEGSVAAKISAAVSTAKGELTTEINKKADSSTVGAIDTRVQTLENAGYQNANQVSGAITTALDGYATEDYVGTKIQDATANMATDTEVENAINALSAEGGAIANLSATVAGKQDELSENQMKAVNSGITAELVATYDTAVTKANAAIPMPEGACATGANCVLSTVGGTIQWVNITEPSGLN